MKITVILSDVEVASINNDIVDIEEWIQKAVAGRINKAKKNFRKEWIPKLIDDPTMINVNATDAGFFQQCSKHKDYRNFEQRKSEEVIDD